MRILAISHIFPHFADPQQGVFAARQFVGLQGCGAEVVVFYPIIRIPKFLGLFKSRWRSYDVNHTPLADYGLRVFPTPWIRLTRGAGSCRWDGLMIYHGMKTRALELHRQDPFDVVYGRGLFPGADTAARLSRWLRIPAVGVAIGGDVNVTPLHSRAMHHHFVNVLQKLDAVLANGQGVADTIRKATGRECQTAHGVVDLSVFRPVEKDPLRRELGLPADRTLLLYAGNLIREKGLYELIDAFEQAKRDCAAALLAVCGRGAELEGIKTLIQRRSLTDDVRMVGQVVPTEMHKWMQASDVFILPSYQEGMPNAVMEAMACGLPVISTTVGGLPAAIGDSDGAILVAPKSVDSLAGAISKVCASKYLRDRMSLAALRTAVERFGVENNCTRIVAFLKSVSASYHDRHVNRIRL